MTRIFFIIAAIGALMIGASQITAQVGAGDWDTYDEAEFMMAQKKGKTIVVDVDARWCPTCRAQAPILEELREERQANDILFVKVNYDRDRAFLSDHRIPRQSTVLVFNGTNEVVRSIAETNRERLRRVILNAL